MHLMNFCHRDIMKPFEITKLISRQINLRSGKPFSTLDRSDFSKDRTAFFIFGNRLKLKLAKIYG